jgi:hypothetical protein
MAKCSGTVTSKPNGSKKFPPKPKKKEEKKKK